MEQMILVPVFICCAAKQMEVREKSTSSEAYFFILMFINNCFGKINITK